MNDVIVIGAGFAGLMGAAALCDRGLRPLILTRGNGTTHWSHGCIDLFGYGHGRANEPIEAPMAAIGDLVASTPAHPYALAGLDQLRAACERFRQIMADAGYPFVGSLDRNVMVPTAAGALRPTALLPITMAAADMRLGGELLVVGFQELRDFFPPMIAANLRAQGYSARSAYLKMPPNQGRLDYFPTVLARLFDDPAFRADVGAQVRALRSGATRVAFPAVLGFDRPLEVLRDLQARCGAQVFEIPMLPPSVPGIRIWERMKHALVAMGARVEIGSEVVRGEAETGESKLRHIWSKAPARERQHRARAFLLATGGILGGGLVADEGGVVRETALGLPVAAPPDQAMWFDAEFDGEHRLFRAGVRVDARFRPCDEAGQVVYSNVTVAGASLAGADAIEERSLEGIALATGWAAGQHLADGLQA